MSPLQFRLLETLAECEQVRESWNALAQGGAGGPPGFDQTMTFEWSQSLWETFLPDTRQTIVVAEEGGNVVGILPCYRASATSAGLPFRKLEIFPRLCPNRTGFLLDRSSPEVLAAILRYVQEEVPDWEVLCVDLVEGSPSQAAVEELARGGIAKFVKVDNIATPAIPLPVDPDEYFGALSKNLRHNIRRYSEKKLGGLGPVQIRFYESESDVPEFLDKMLSIERASWKEAAGTSITAHPEQERLYRAFTPRGARNGWLLGTVISINGNPVAYSYGFVYGNVFAQEKSSFSEQYRDYSPGTLVPVVVIRELCRRGIAIFDWMGRADDHKLRWNHTLYARSTVWIFNRSIRAEMIRQSLAIKQVIRNWRRPAWSG